MFDHKKNTDINIINIEGITKDYLLGKTKISALKGINLRIAKGEFLSIAGSSGSGKTTLLNIIGCIDKPTRGAYELAGRNIILCDENALTKIRKEKIGYIFQSFNLIPVLSAFENIEYPLLLRNKLSKSERKEKIDYYLNRVGLFEQRKQRPNELSGGQRQRVAIARALIKDPDIVLADEPTANIDSKTGMKIIELMKQLNEEKRTTFIFSTHDPQVLNQAKRVEFIQDGILVKEEMHD